MIGNKHYIETDENNFITKLFSSAFEQPTDDSILLREETSRHAFLITQSVGEQLRSMQGYYKYKWINDEVVEATEEDSINNNLDSYKTQILTRISQEVGVKIVAGVEYEGFIYNTKIEDQVYLNNLKVRISLGDDLSTIEFGMYAVSTGEYVIKTYTNTQLLEIIALVEPHIEGLLQPYKQLKLAVLNASDKASIDTLVSNYEAS